MKAIALVNPAGGRAGEDSGDRVAEALRNAGVAAEIAVVSADQLGEQAGAAAEAGAQLVIAAGGDGTVSAVAGALVGTNAALGILPLGTFNHLARDLGIPFELDAAAAVIAAAQRRAIDVARLDAGPTFSSENALDNFIRLAFAAPAETLMSGIDGLAAVWHNMRSPHSCAGVPHHVG
jgi:diacylglycerol kinase family enzyme